tara:strand:- start:28838 stop:28954 length:117 start_codon:yes stop_codon:yes gene_type:complete
MIREKKFKPFADRFPKLKAKEFKPFKIKDFDFKKNKEN